MSIKILKVRPMSRKTKKRLLDDELWTTYYCGRKVMINGPCRAYSFFDPTDQITLRSGQQGVVHSINENMCGHIKVEVLFSVIMYGSCKLWHTYVAQPHIKQILTPK